VLTHKKLKNDGFWDVTPCGLVMSTNISEKRATSINMIVSSTLKMEAADFSETSAQKYPITQHHIWET
jgi:hypothetical protein